MSLKQKIDKIENELSKQKNFVGTGFTNVNLIKLSEKKIFRMELESLVKRFFKVNNQDANTINIKKAETSQLLEILGYSSDGKGKEKFRDDHRTLFALRKHNNKIPHVCAEFCPMHDFVSIVPSEKHRFVEDVKWYLDFFMRKIPQCNFFSAAVSLYIFCKRRVVRGLDTALLEALDELQSEGIVFSDPEMDGKYSKVSECLSTELGNEDFLKYKKNRTRVCDNL
jgi:hypothetical protein